LRSLQTAFCNLLLEQCGSGLSAYSFLSQPASTSQGWISLYIPAFHVQLCVIVVSIGLSKASFPGYSYLFIFLNFGYACSTFFVFPIMGFEVLVGKLHHLNYLLFRCYQFFSKGMEFFSLSELQFFPSCPYFQFFKSGLSHISIYLFFFCITLE